VLIAGEAVCARWGGGRLSETSGDIHVSVARPSSKAPPSTMAAA
jgi:hypothetical protein